MAFPGRPSPRQRRPGKAIVRDLPGCDLLGCGCAPYRIRGLPSVDCRDLVERIMSESKPVNTDCRRVAILFAGGPAPAANAVISTCAASFIKRGIQVLGILRGYSNLVKF